MVEAVAEYHPPAPTDMQREKQLRGAYIWITAEQPVTKTLGRGRWDLCAS